MGIKSRMVKQIALDGGNLITKVVTWVYMFLFKVITYPIIGNLSAKIQYGFQNLVGKKWFDADRATQISFITNYPIYTTLSTLCLYLTYNLLSRILTRPSLFLPTPREDFIIPVVLGITIGLILATADVIIRRKTVAYSEHCYEVHGYCYIYHYKYARYKAIGTKIGYILESICGLTDKK